MGKQWRSTVLAVALAVVHVACGGKQGMPETETTGTVQSVGESTPASATTTGVTGGTSSSMTPDDKEFVASAGMAGLSEVQLGNLALERTQNADVRAFAQRMVTDHSAGNAELSQLATAKGVALPAELGGAHKSALEHLNTLNGAEFDKAYMQHMVPDHLTAVADFERASTSSQDAEVKAWAAKTLPTLKEHLQMAQMVSAKVP